MGVFSNLSANLSLNISNFSSNLRQATVQMRAFARNLDGTTNTTDALNRSTTAWGLNIKSVSRVVSGILISQTFYSALSSIKSCTNAVYEFSSSLEYAKVAYTNLFNDTALAEEFINVLKDFAATSPFDFSESEAAAKRLLAYGVEYKNVMYIMQGVMAAASMQGDASKVESISRALGQIYTKGRLMNQEMNQLTEAGIPAWDILIEKLGLTEDQIGNIGTAGINATDAINALVDGMNERFGNVITASTYTLKGVISNARDNFLILTSGLTEPLFGQIKAIASAIGTLMFNLREAFENFGAGGVFEALIPPELQSTMRTFIANLMNLWNVLKYLVAAAVKALGNALYGLVVVFNAISPVVIAVSDVLARFMYAVTSNATAMRILTGMLMTAAAAWVIFKIQALGALVLTGISKVIILTAKAIQFLAISLVSSPILTILTLLAAVLIGVSVASSGAGKSLQDLWKNMTALNGVDPDTLLLPEQKERANDLEKFNQKLEGTSDGMDDLADSANKAKKSLLSFDEVFRLTDSDKGTDTDLNLDIPDLGNLDMEAYIPEVPDFNGFATDFVDKLKTALGDKLRNAGLGALLGGIIGLALGGLPGAKIGAAIGAFAGYFWDDVAAALGLSDTEELSIPIGATIGAAIGALVGNPLIGAAIGALAGWFIGALIDVINGDETSAMHLSLSLGALVGSAIGLIAGGPAGAAIGAAVGALVGWFVGELADFVMTGDPGNIGMSMGVLIGGAIGLVAGGPAGAVVGAAVGGLVGWILQSFIEGFTTGEWDSSAVATAIGGGIGAAIGLIIGGPVGALLGGAIGSLVGWLSDMFVNGDWKISEAFVQPFADLIIWIEDTIADIWTHIKDAFESGDPVEIGMNIVAGLIVGIESFFELIPRTLYAIFKAFYDGICDLFGIHSPSTEMATIGTYIIEGLLKGISDMFNNIGKTIAEVGSMILGAFKDIFGDAYDAVTSWVSDTVSSVAQWGTDFVSKAASGISSFAGSIKTGLDTAFTNISSFCSSALTKISGWAGDFKNAISGALDWAGGKIEAGWDAVSSTASGAYNYARDAVRGLSGHADGGVFDREHIARVSENNKSEAIIPLENATAMQPFVDAVANGLTATLAPMFAGGQSSSELQPLYVGTLIADDRSLKELERKMNIIRMQEDRRR